MPSATSIDSSVVEIKASAQRLRHSAWLAAGIVAVIYFSAMKLALRLTSGGAAIPVWPAAGVALAALILSGNRYWPVLFATAWLSDVSEGADWMAAAGFAAGQVIEALAGVKITSFVARVRWHLGNFDVLAGTLLVASVTPLTGAVIGATTVCFLQGKIVPRT